MNSMPLPQIFKTALIVMLGLFQVTTAQAQSDDQIKGEIEAKFSASEILQNAPINIFVEHRLVVLTGDVRLLEQRLVSDRIAWTTVGVFEVDNEIRVVPSVAKTDKAIEAKVYGIIKSYQRFDKIDMVISVKGGVVSIESGFSGVGDPIFLKHKVAAIEGVIDVKVRSTFMT